MRKPVVEIGHVAPESRYVPGPGTHLFRALEKCAEMTSAVLTTGGMWCASCVQTQATCNNTQGSVECTCIAGYEGNGALP